MARPKIDKGHWEVCEDEAANVREIFALYGAAWSLTQIAADLTARRVTRPPYPGAPRTTAPGHLWRPSFISVILNCRTYTGVLTERRARRVPTAPGSAFKTTRVPRPVEEQVVLAVPAIISQETWEAVARLRDVNGKRRRKLEACGRQFVPGTPLRPPSAPDQPALLAWPCPPEPPPAPPKRRAPSTDAPNTPPRPAAGRVGVRQPG